MLGFSLTPNTSFSQNYEDTIVRTIEDSTVDTLEEDDSTTLTENTKKDLGFTDARIDTSSVQMRLIFNDTIAKMKLQDAYQYHPKNNEAIKREKKVNNTKPLVSSAFLEFLFWLLAIGFLVVIIVVYAMDGNVNVFSKRNKKVQTTTEDTDVFNQNIFDLDFPKLIQQAIDSLDYNKAARLGFLKLLTILNNKKLIEYSIDKTNFDYQFQLIHTKHYQNFLLTANYYEYAWFSGIVINANQYNKIANGFKQFEEQLN